MFPGHQHRPAPLAADRDALHHSQQNQQHRGRSADLGIGRQQADAHRHHAHHHEGDHQGLLAPDAVADMAEYHATQRSREKAHGEGAEGGHGAEQFIV